MNQQKVYITLSILTKTILFFALALIITSCFPDVSSTKESEVVTETKKPEEAFSYKTIELPVILTERNSAKSFDSITSKASIENQCLIFELDLSKINNRAFPVANITKDTLTTTIFNVEFTYNKQAIPIHFSKKKHKWLFRNGFETQSDSVLSFSSGEKNLDFDKQISVAVPMYVFEKFPAGKAITLEVRIWQDHFFSERKEEAVLTNNIKHSRFYKDTLKTKLIDNSYAFTVTIPEIYKTTIVCDSIILQNDSAWSPYGSDHTLFRSSLPDIYFSLEDFAENLQSSSHVEKSSTKFLTADTLAFYHYKDNEPFYLSVYDFDLLSKNDLLGRWKGKLTEMTDNKRYKIKFGHISDFYIKKRSSGKVN